MTQGTMGTPDGVEETRPIDAQHGRESTKRDNAGRVNNEVFDALFGGEHEAWPEQATKKGLRASWPMSVLVALLLVIGGVASGRTCNDRIRRRLRRRAALASRDLPASAAAGAAAGGAAASTRRYVGHRH